MQCYSTDQPNIHWLSLRYAYSTYRGTYRGVPGCTGCGGHGRYKKRYNITPHRFATDLPVPATPSLTVPNNLRRSTRACTALRTHKHAEMHAYRFTRLHTAPRLYSCYVCSVAITHHFGGQAKADRWSQCIFVLFRGGAVEVSSRPVAVWSGPVLLWLIKSSA